MGRKKMVRISKGYGRYVVALAAMLVLLLGGCSGDNEKAPENNTNGGNADEFDSPRDADNAAIREIIADFNTWTMERDADEFKDDVTETFDAAAFIDSLWAGVDAQRVEFSVRRLRLSDDEARVVINAVFTKDGTVTKGRFIVFEFRPIEGEWKAISFQLFGPAS